MKTNYDLAKSWSDIAHDDYKMAELAISNGLYLHAMFHIQQCIEKSIKGLIVYLLETDPPYTHDLVRLIRELNPILNYSNLVEKDLTVLNPYYISSRYPSYKENLKIGLTKTKVSKFLELAKEILSWLDHRLKS